MSRRVIWLQLLIGWFPLTVLFTVLIASAHGIDLSAGAILAVRMIVSAAVLGILVQRLVENYPFPRPVRVKFVLAHAGYAFAYSTVLLLVNSAIESAMHGQLVLTVGPSLPLTFFTGVWLYVMIAGVAYTSISTERAAQAEAEAAKAQLAALRAQLHPHFLFNALHTVVQLIPREPKRAADAAEQLAGLLRTTIEEDRDLVTVAEECAFVERYVAIEQMRFGDRLSVSMQVEESAQENTIPVFALQTLVENAVRHGAAPRVEPTDIVIRGRLVGDRLEMIVTDNGAGTSDADAKGTGLRRLRERLAALYGGDASLIAGPLADAGYSATLSVPVRDAES